MNHYVMDYETLKNCFVAVFMHYKTNDLEIFVVHELRNDFNEFIEFLEKNKNNKEWHISYNGLAFDAQVTHYIIDNYENVKDLSATEISNFIYDYAQKTIKKQNNLEWSDYAPWNLVIGQIDVFKLNHWDNPQKKSSLKWIQYSMDWENLLDMPIHHSTEIKTQEELDTIIEYCINDVKSTKEIYSRSKSEIALRKNLTDTYNINLYSASEPRISKELFMHHLSKSMYISKKELRSLRTYRESIIVKDIVLDKIEFKTAEFNNLLERFKSLELDPDKLKGSFKNSVGYMEVKTHFGLGGVHGATESGIYESDEDMIIVSSDVTSFYPNLAIRNKWSPAHLPNKEFCDTYEWFFNERKKIPKSNPMNYVYKIILNSTFGLSNEKNSFMYDPEYLIKVTVNGQLTLMMLYEMIMEEIPEAKSLMQNTDGIETLIPRDSLDKYYEICKKWEELTNLNLEHDSYQKLVLADVNNYIAIYPYKEVDITTWRNIKSSNPHYLFRVRGSKFEYAPAKCKGRFSFTDLMLHKNKSKLIIPKALFNYFIKGILPEETLKSNRNILDYCIGGKSKGEWKQIARYIDDNKQIEDDLQKINRYYVSNSGVKIIKVNPDGREIQLEAGRWMQTIYNDMTIKNWDDYNVDIKYYIQAIEREINNIIMAKAQLKLF